MVRLYGNARSSSAFGLAEAAENVIKPDARAKTDMGILRIRVTTFPWHEGESWPGRHRYHITVVASTNHVGFPAD
jgi:hypothetical protein